MGIKQYGLVLGLVAVLAGCITGKSASDRADCYKAFQVIKNYGEPISSLARGSQEELKEGDRHLMLRSENGALYWFAIMEKDLASKFAVFNEGAQMSFPCSTLDRMLNNQVEDTDLRQIAPYDSFIS